MSTVSSSFKGNLYTLQQVISIKNDGFKYNIPENILSTINNISKQVGAPTYNKTPTFTKAKKKTSHLNNRREITPEDWGIIRNFKATEKKEYTEIETAMNSIRGYLNKITDKNYESQKKLVINKLQEIIDSFTDKEATDVCETLFNIACGNKFYSSLYAQLLKELISKYDIVNNIYKSKLKDYLNLFTNIETCDPNENYDLFCELNKKNDNRRALSAFFVNLMKINVLEKNYIIKLILNLQEKLLDNVNKDNKKTLIEELSENIFLLVTESCKDIDDENEWDSIKECIVDISNMDIKNNKSLSNKTVFKHLDMLDEIN